MKNNVITWDFKPVDSDIYEKGGQIITEIMYNQIEKFKKKHYTFLSNDSILKLLDSIGKEMDELRDELFFDYFPDSQNAYMLALLKQELKKYNQKIYVLLEYQLVTSINHKKTKNY